MKKLFYLLLLGSLLTASACSKESESDPTPAVITPPAPPTIWVSMNGGAYTKLINPVVQGFTLGGTGGATGINSLDLYGQLGGNVNIAIKYYPSGANLGSPVSIPLGKIILYRGTAPTESISVSGGASNLASNNPTAPNTASGVFQATLSDYTQIDGKFIEAWTQK